MNDAKIIELLNGRGFAILAAIALVVTAVIATTLGGVPPIDVGNGMFFDLSAVPFQATQLTMFINVALIIATGMLMLLLNKLYNFVKAFTFVGAAVFFLLELALPMCSSVLNVGTILCLVLVMGTLVLFGTYEDKYAQRPIFLITCVLAFGMMFNWAFVALIVAFVLGFAYMRAMNWKGFFAVLIGLFTPFWIAFGLGLVSPEQFNLLEINSVWNTLAEGQVRAMVIWIVAVVVATIVLSAINLFSIYHYRLQLRVYNAFFLLVTLVSVVGVCVDYRDMLIFVPMLNLCLSVQVAHSFTISTFPKRYIFIFVLVIATLVAFVANLLL